MAAASLNSKAKPSAHSACRDLSSCIENKTQAAPHMLAPACQPLPQRSGALGNPPELHVSDPLYHFLSICHEKEHACVCVHACK